MGLFGPKKQTPAATGSAGRELTLPDGSRVTVAREIDCLGLSCPRPQLMTKKAVQEAKANDVIAVLIDNPTSVEAIPPLCRGMNATHLATLKEPRHWEVVVRRNG